MPVHGKLMNLVGLIVLLHSRATFFHENHLFKQVPGRAEADFARFDVRTVVKRIYILFTWSELQVAGKDEEILDLVDPSAPLPSWFSEEDLSFYASLYEKSGFHYALYLPYR